MANKVISTVHNLGWKMYAHTPLMFYPVLCNINEKAFHTWRPETPEVEENSRFTRELNFQRALLQNNWRDIDLQPQQTAQQKMAATNKR